MNVICNRSDECKVCQCNHIRPHRQIKSCSFNECVLDNVECIDDTTYGIKEIS